MSVLAIEAGEPKYAPLLTVWTKTGADTWEESPGPLRVIISGNRDMSFMLGQPVRRAAFDGRLSDLGDGLPASFMPWISNSWPSVFDWHGSGAMPADQREKLDEIVAAVLPLLARNCGSTPRRTVRRSVTCLSGRRSGAAGVDRLNTDELAALQSFLLANPY